MVVTVADRVRWRRVEDVDGIRSKKGQIRVVVLSINALLALAIGNWQLAATWYGARGAAEC